MLSEMWCLTEFSLPDFSHLIFILKGRYLTAGTFVVLNLFQIITIYYNRSVSRFFVHLEHNVTAVTL